MTRLLVPGPGGSLETAASWPSLRNREFLLVPGSEYEVLRVDVPPVSGERLDAALPWRIRALYPGSTESTVLDHRPVAGNPKLRLVFAADRDRLAALRAAAGNRPLAPAGLLLASAVRKGSWTGILAGADWAEVVRLDGKTVLDSRRIHAKNGEGDAAEALSRALLPDLADSPEHSPIVAALCRDAESGGDALRRALEDALPGRNVLVSPLEKVIPCPSEEACGVFRPRRTHPLANPRTIARALTALALLLAASVPSRLSRIREAELELVKADYEAALSRSGRVVALAAERDSLEGRLRELKAARRPDAYRVLSDIALGAGTGVRARSLVLEGLSFRMEAEGSDGLSVLGRLRDSGLFESLDLLQSVVDPRGGERYTIMGRVKP